MTTRTASSRAPFVITLLFLLMLPLAASAQQDIVNVYVDRNQSFGWAFTFQNNHASPVNHILISLQTPGVAFTDASTAGPNNSNNWSGSPSNGQDSAEWVTTGPFVSQGQKDSVFTFSLLDTNVFDEPVTIRWQSMNNNTVVSSGSFSIIPTQWQWMKHFDAVYATASTLPNGDPLFNFRVVDSNEAHSAINQISFESYASNQGSIRPSDVIAPPGWFVDSVTSTTAYFHAPTGQEIQSNSSLSGFKVGLRANNAATNFSFIWRAYYSGAIIDRDTVKNIPATVTASSDQTSNDTITLASQKGCTFNLAVANDHISNALAPSAITSIRFQVTTPGVLLTDSKLPNANWGSIGGTGNGTDTMVFITASALAAQPAGTTLNYGFDVSNPSAIPFNVNWQTFDSSNHQLRQVSSGTIALSCGTVVTDTAWVTANGNCSYTLTVKNRHTSGTAVHAVSVVVPSGNKLTSTFTPPTGWTATGNETAVRFTNNNGGADIAAGGTANFGFSLVTGGKDIPMTWQGYEVGTDKNTGSGTIPLTCSIASVCDTVVFSPAASINGNSCAYSFVITNRRTDLLSVTSVTIAANNGWKIDSAVPQFTWSNSISSDGSSVTYTSPSGFLAQHPNFIVSFKGGQTGTFQTTVTTADNNQKTCTNVADAVCQLSSVDQERITESLDLAVSPNPLSKHANVSFRLDQPQHVSVLLLDVLGRPVQTIANTIMNGDQALTLDASSLAAGTYYLRVESSFGRATKKLVIEK